MTNLQMEILNLVRKPLLLPLPLAHRRKQVRRGILLGLEKSHKKGITLMAWQYIPTPLVV